jgi:hypothetical protein
MTFIKKTLNVASLVAMTTAVHPQTFTRKPFLQKGSYNRASICWRVSAATSLTVKYGTDSTNLSMTSPPSASAADACVALDTATLQPATKYFYEVYNGATKLTGSARQYFITAPAVGSKKKSTFWILGDPGSAGTAQTNVKNAFNKVNQGAPIDGIIMLGDNAYESGTDAEFNTGLFNIYPDAMATAFVWPAVGNHEAVASSSAASYLASFYLPSGGESGGVPSGSELYYSFNYANIHFIILDSQVSARTKTGAQYLWLQQDLQATRQDWIVAYWHHPPYSFSGHNSNTEQQMVDMRTNFLPLLEQYGVDITYTGHSHDYERSYLIDSAYGNSTDNNSKKARIILDNKSGNPATTGPYRKPSMKGAHEGAVHMVAGSSAKLDPVTAAHPVMFTQQSVYGSVILTIEDTVATSKFIDSSGAVKDQFQIVKTRGTVTHLGRPAMKQDQANFFQMGRRFRFPSDNPLAFRIYTPTGTVVSQTIPRGNWEPSAKAIPAGVYYYRYGGKFGKISLP